MPPDHYEVLGVDAGAGHAEIRAAYRRLMREVHPDMRPGDPGAEEVARRATAAWAVLGRPAVRAVYDRTRSAARQPAPPLVVREPPPAPAYSSEGTDYRRAFHFASLKVASAVVAIGLVALLAFTAA